MKKSKRVPLVKSETTKKSPQLFPHENYNNERYRSSLEHSSFVRVLIQLFHLFSKLKKIIVFMVTMVMPAFVLNKSVRL